MCVLEAGACVLNLGLGDLERFLSRLGLERLKKGPRRFCLRFLLCCRSPLNGIVDHDERHSLPNALPLGNQDPGDGSPHFRLDVDILAMGLVALDDAVRVNPFAVRVGGGIERRRRRLFLDAENIRTHQAGRESDDGKDEDDLILHVPPPCAMPVILPSSIFIILSAYSKILLSWVTIIMHRLSLRMFFLTKSTIFL